MPSQKQLDFYAELMIQESSVALDKYLTLDCKTNEERWKNIRDLALCLCLIDFIDEVNSVHYDKLLRKLLRDCISKYDLKYCASSLQLFFFVKDIRPLLYYCKQTQHVRMLRKSFNWDLFC